MEAREFDLVLVGASGFVGRLTAQHLARHTPAGTRVALAGCNAERLEAVRRDLPGHPDCPLLLVDTLDPVAVRDLAARTRVVATTVGPYAAYGRELIAACAERGTHYADLTGEVLFVREAIDRHHDTAVASGARIVPSCGFDSVPSDLGVLVTAQRAAADREGTLADTTLRVTALKGGISGGTIDSMRQQVIAMRRDAASRRVVADPYALSPDRSAEPYGSRPAGVGRLVGRGGDGQWSAPFVMAAYNTRVVRRSNALTGWSYGRGLRYDEVLDTGRGPLGAVRAVGMTVGAGLAAGAMMTAPTRAVLDRLLPKPGQGPSDATMANGRFAIRIDAVTTTGARYRTVVAADADPGYSATAIMLGESALALAVDEGQMSARSGVLTPATAIGDRLVERLRDRGFTFEVERTS